MIGGRSVDTMIKASIDKYHVINLIIHLEIGSVGQTFLTFHVGCEYASTQ